MSVSRPYKCTDRINVKWKKKKVAKELFNYDSMAINSVKTHSAISAFEDGGTS